MSEDTPLLPVERCAARASLKPRFCIRSRLVHYILLWNSAVIMIYRGLYDITNFVKITEGFSVVTQFSSLFTFVAIFSTFAGVVTDVKFSRYRVIMCSSYLIIVGIIFIVIVRSVHGAVIQYTTRPHIPFIVLDTIGLLLLLAPVMMYLVNALQFGMDQLHDSPTEDFVLYIHWYIWICYVAQMLAYLVWNFISEWVIYKAAIEMKDIVGASIAILLVGMTVILLIVSLCVVKHKQNWFHIEPPGVNPYKLVYRVTKFAYQNKVPLRRSAFTYCEDELPPRMDLGKEKYGGPFTTREVEDVKAFWGILKVLICIGPAFMLQTAVQISLSMFAKHSNLYLTNINHTFDVEGTARHLFISNGLLSPILVVICIPLYLTIIRPHISYRIPGLLKRMGLGMTLLTLSNVAALAMDVVVHVRKTKDANCMFSGLTHVGHHGYHVHSNSDHLDITSLPLYQNVYFFISQHFLTAAANILLDVAVLEFICSQSPHSMKGLILSFYFSIKAFMQAIVVALTFPFGLAWHIQSLSCGSGFYLMNVVTGAVALALFVFMANGYKYRTVNEPSREYQYAEDYYSK